MVLDVTVAVGDGAKVVADAREEVAERCRRPPLAGLDSEDDTAQGAGDEPRGSRDERRRGACND